MTWWYAAHLITYLKLKNEFQSEYPVQESIILIQADSVEAAYEAAEKIGQSDFNEKAETSTMQLNGKPAYWVFGGVRKLMECHDLPSKGTNWYENGFVPGHGTELTYLDLVVEGEESLRQLIAGEAVKLFYDESVVEDAD